MIGLTLVLGLTVLGTAASLFRPYYGVLVYVFFAIIRPHDMFPGALPRLPYSQILVGAILAGFVFRGFGDWKLSKGKVAFFGLLAYLAWDLISATRAPIWEVAWGHFDSQIRILVPCILAILIATSITEARFLAWAIALGEGLVALRFHEYYYILGRGVELQWGTFGSKDNNLWSVDLTIGAVTCFFLALSTRRLWLKAVPAVLGVFCVSAVMFLYSRGGQLALIAAGATAFLYLPKRPRFLAAFAAAVLVVAALAGPSVVEEFSTIFVESSQRDSSSTGRLELWKAMADISRQNPLFGVGPDHFPIVSGEYGFREREGHNVWLQWAAELGLPALFAMLLFFLAPLPHLWRLRRSPEKLSPEEADDLKYIAGGAVCSVIAFGVGSQFIAIDLLEAPMFVGTLGIVLLKVAGRVKNLAADAAAIDGHTTVDQRQTWSPLPRS